MKNIVGVKFKEEGKVYFFDPGKLVLEKGMNVIVETINGDSFGVVERKQIIDETKLKTELRPVKRIASFRDKKQNEENKKKEKEAFKICEEKIKKHNLEMNLVEVEYIFDNSKIIFYFTADNRIDFRELVKDLASVFRVRIELRQIGVRDQIKRMGGNGICGRELCCCSFLENYGGVAINMAKDQNLSLNPGKISGNCGRLMCCLKYENEVYTEKIKKLPGIGSIVMTKEGKGEVCGVENLKEILKVKLKDGDETYYKKYNLSDIQIIKKVQLKQENEDENDNIEDIKELKKLEKLDEIDKKNSSK